jgi:hypothetical protein
MKNFKLKAVAAAAILAASAPALSAIQDGELLLNVRYYGGTSATTGGDDMSALFDLGMTMNDALAKNGQAGYSKTWDMSAGDYGAAWNQIKNFAGPNADKLEFNVIALDHAGARYLTTGNVDSWPSQGNANVKGFQNMEMYVDANKDRGNHGQVQNGASTATPTDDPNTFFGAINGFGQGDNWLAKTTVDTTQPLGTAQHFWFLTPSSNSSLAQATKTPFGVDMNGDGKVNSSNEFSSFNLTNTGNLTFANPSSVSPIPEADTWAMLLAGLSMLGVIVRRRTNV